MEVEYVGKRAHLFDLLHQHPDWTLQQYADAVGCSQSMVCTWRQCFRQAEEEGRLDTSIFFSRSRAPHHRPPRLDEEVKERVQEIRLDPPNHLKRTPGPLAILYYLHRDQTLRAKGTRLPRSSRTIWRILDDAGLIERDPVRKRSPRQPLDPLEEVQMDAHQIVQRFLSICTILTPNEPMSLKPAILWMLGPPSSLMLRCMKTFTPKPLLRRSWPSCGAMDAQRG